MANRQNPNNSTSKSNNENDNIFSVSDFFSEEEMSAINDVFKISEKDMLIDEEKESDDKENFEKYAHQMLSNDPHSDEKSETQKRVDNILDTAEIPDLFDSNVGDAKEKSDGDSSLSDQTVDSLVELKKGAQSNFMSKIKSGWLRLRNKVEMEFKISDAKKDMLKHKITCLYCFNKFDRNDIFFRKHEGILQYDNLYFKQIYSQNSDAIAMRQKLVIDWHHYHQDSLIVKHGIVEGIYDTDDEMVTEKICPFCHFPVEDLGSKIPLKITGVSCDDQTKQSGLWENFRSQLISCGEKNGINITSWKKKYSRFSGLNFEDENGGVYKNLILFDGLDKMLDDQSRLMSVCDHAILIIKPSLSDKQMNSFDNFDIAATEYVGDFVKKYGDENSLFIKPLAISFDLEDIANHGNGFDFSEFMSKYHTPLINFLNNHCANYKIFPIDLSRENHEKSMSDILNWIADQNKL